MRGLTFKFMNMAGPFPSVYKDMIKPKERRYVKDEAPWMKYVAEI